MIQIITRYGNLLLLAMGQTLLLALCGLFFACILGMFFGLLSVLKNKACRIISSIFVDVIRGVPMIVLAYFIYFGVPYCLNNMMGFSFTLTALQAGTLVNTAKNVVANSFMSFQTWGIVAIMYLIVITILSKIAKVLERRLNRGRK